MKIAIYGGLHGYQDRIERQYRHHKFSFHAVDKSDKETISLNSEFHIICIKFVNHNVFKKVRNHFPDNKVLKINGGLSQLFSAIESIK